MKSQTHSIKSRKKHYLGGKREEKEVMVLRALLQKLKGIPVPGITMFKATLIKNLDKLETATCLGTWKPQDSNATLECSPEIMMYTCSYKYFSSNSERVRNTPQTGI